MGTGSQEMAIAMGNSKQQTLPVVRTNYLCDQPHPTYSNCTNTCYTRRADNHNGKVRAQLNQNTFRLHLIIVNFSLLLL